LINLPVLGVFLIKTGINNTKTARNELFFEKVNG